MQESFQAGSQSADIKGESDFEAVWIHAAAVSFNGNHLPQNLSGVDRIIAGGPCIAAKYKKGLRTPVKYSKGGR